MSLSDIFPAGAPCMACHHTWAYHSFDGQSCRSKFRVSCDLDDKCPHTHRCDCPGFTYRGATHDD